MSEILSTTTLRQGASAGNEITFTVVPTAAATRIGIDRDGDVCDPCTAPQPFIKPKLTIAKLALPSGDETLGLSGKTTVPTSPAIDPATNGVRFLLTASNGTSVLDVTIPGGANRTAHGDGAAVQVSRSM